MKKFLIIFNSRVDFLRIIVMSNGGKKGPRNPTPPGDREQDPKHSHEQHRPAADVRGTRNPEAKGTLGKRCETLGLVFDGAIERLTLLLIRNR